MYPSPDIYRETICEELMVPSTVDELSIYYTQEHRYYIRFGLVVSDVVPLLVRHRVHLGTK